MRTRKGTLRGLVVMFPAMVLALVLAGTALGQSSVEQLPLNSRCFQRLLVSYSELVANQARSLDTVAGAHQYILDGAGMQETMWQENSVIRPPGLESLPEFKVENKSVKDAHTTSIVMSAKRDTDKLPPSQK